MRLFEIFESDSDFDESEPLRVATTAVLSKIKSEIDDSAYRSEFTVNALLSKLAAYGIRISHDQLIDLVDQEPWSNLISNIQGNQVVFKGSQEDDTSPEIDDPDDSEATLDQMSKRATKKKEM